MNKDREKVVDIFWKMNSEGQDYYFTNYTTVRAVAEKLEDSNVDPKLIQDFIERGNAVYGNPRQLFKDTLEEIMAQFEIIWEEVES